MYTYTVLLGLAQFDLKDYKFHTAMLPTYLGSNITVVVNLMSEAVQGSQLFQLLYMLLVELIQMNVCVM